MTDSFQIAHSDFLEKNNRFLKKSIFIPILLLIFFRLFIPGPSYAQNREPMTEKESFEEGRRRLDQKDLEGALEMFESVLSKNVRHAPSYLNLGLIHTRLGQIDLAIKAFESATGIDQDGLAAHLLLGQAYAAKGRNQEAKAAFERTIEIKPDFPRGHFLLGVLYETEGQVSEALKRYRVVVGLDGEALEITQASERVEKFETESALHFNEGMEALKIADFTSAEAAFRKSILIDSVNIFTLYNLATIVIKKDELNEAIDFLQQTLKVKKDFFAARLLLGEVYERKGEIPLAIDTYSSVVSLAHNQDGEMEKLARQKLDQIGRSAVQARLAQKLLKDGLAHFEKGRYESAKGSFIVVLSILPRQIFSHYKLGQLAFISGDYPAAVRRFKETIIIDSTHYLSQMGLGESYERLNEQGLAMGAYQEAVRLKPDEENPKIGLARLYEKLDRVDEALSTYHEITSIPGGSESEGKKHAQKRIDFYEKRYHVDFSSTSLTFDSNRNRTEQPVSEIESSNSLGLIYFLNKRERFRTSARLQVNTRLLHRSQLHFINESFSLVSLWNIQNMILVQGVNLSTGTSGGVRVTSERSFSSIGYSLDAISIRDIPSEMTLHFEFENLKALSNPIFNAKRGTFRISLSQNLVIDGMQFGRLGLNYGVLDNNVRANDQRRYSQTVSLNYRRALVGKLSASIGITARYTRFRYPDSLSLSQSLPQRRRNYFNSTNIGLNYRPSPGTSLYLQYARQKNRSSLPAAGAIDLVTLNAGQAGSLGSYDRELITFGASISTDLSRPYPSWKRIQKRLSVALTTAYFRPSLKELNRIISDPKQVIIQDPNHLLPINPIFASEEKNLSTGPITGNIASGVEIEWEMNNRHALVLSISEWQNETVSQDQMPLVLSPEIPAILVPRSARYNLSVNQFLLTWRYMFVNAPDTGRFYFNIGLLGGAFSNLTIDSLMKVANNPLGDHFASLGSIETRSRSFTTRLGIGGSILIRPWLSLGVEANYLFGEVAKLKVEREFPADFSNVPVGNDGSCLRVVDTETQGETLVVFECENNQIIEGSRGRFLKLRLDGYEARLMLKFHLGDIITGKTGFERYFGGESDTEKKSFLTRFISSAAANRLAISGVFKNETAYRVSEPVSFTKSLFLFRLNTRFDLSKKMSITVRTRSFYDAIYDLVDIDTISPRRFPNTILTQLPQEPTSEEVNAINIRNSRSVEIVRNGFEFREIFLDVHLKRMDLRIGRQIVRWGVVPGARVTDEINPFDFSEFILRSTDDRFIPLLMLRTHYYLDDSQFELIWIPEVVPHRPAPKGSEFEQFEILPGFKPIESFVDSDLSIHSDVFDHSEVAFRMMRNFDGLELAMTAFYTWDDFPTSFRSLDDRAEAFGRTISPPDFSPEQQRITILGTTLSKSVNRVVFNAEFAYTFDKFFGTLLSIGEDNSTLGEAERDYMKYAVGFDFTYRGSDLSVSFLQQYILNWNETILQDRLDTVASLFTRRAFMNDQLVTQMLVLYFINEDDILLRPVVETRLSDRVKFRFGADFFIGDRGERAGEFDFIGFFKDSNRFYLELIRSF